MDKRLVFRNQELNRSFERNGFVIIDLLNSQEVSGLCNLPVLATHNNLEEKFFTTTWLNDAALRLETNREICLRLEPKLETILNGYRFFYGSYFVKKKGEKSMCDVHQDWSSVDEPNLVSVTVWCALSDMNLSNGCLQILPQSHRLNNYVRGRHMTDYLGKCKNILKDRFMRPIQLRQGQAIIFNQRMVHGSMQNLSSETRLACGLVAAPLEAKMKHFVGFGNGSVKIVDAENNFFSRYDTFDKLNDVMSVGVTVDSNKQLSPVSLYLFVFSNILRNWGRKLI